MNKQILRLLALSAMVTMVFVSCNKNDDSDTSGTPLNPANCHVISEPGTYVFQTVKGNSSESVGAVASAEVLWESFGTTETPVKGSIVSEVSFVPSNSLIRFKTPSTLKDGNALIAAKDASGNILWSWHIWVCNGWDPVKTAHTYYNNAGVVMDRNLGATSATPRDVEAFGLLYQWGRKDPFLGWNGVEQRGVVASTLNWPAIVYSDAQTGTIDYSIANPTTFIATVEDNFDWYYTGIHDTDNTRWQAEKTIYDPCPAGWKVPEGLSPNDHGVWWNALGKQFVVLEMEYGNQGSNLAKYFGDDDPIWYPYAGCKRDTDGAIVLTGENAGLWTSSPDLDEKDPDANIMVLALDISITDQGHVMTFTSFDYCRAFGHSVRCVAETSGR